MISPLYYSSSVASRPSQYHYRSDKFNNNSNIITKPQITQFQSHLHKKNKQPVYNINYYDLGLLCRAQLLDYIKPADLKSNKSTKQALEHLDTIPAKLTDLLYINDQINLWNNTNNPNSLLLKEIFSNINKNRIPTTPLPSLIQESTTPIPSPDISIDFDLNPALDNIFSKYNIPNDEIILNARIQNTLPFNFTFKQLCEEFNISQDVLEAWTQQDIEYKDLDPDSDHAEFKVFYHNLKRLHLYLAEHHQILNINLPDKPDYTILFNTLNDESLFQSHKDIGQFILDLHYIQQDMQKLNISFDNVQNTLNDEYLTYIDLWQRIDTYNKNGAKIFGRYFYREAQADANQDNPFHKNLQKKYQDYKIITLSIPPKTTNNYNYPQFLQEIHNHSNNLLAQLSHILLIKQGQKESSFELASMMSKSTTPLTEDEKANIIQQVKQQCKITVQFTNK